MSRTPERIAWTGERAAAEWGVNPRTLAARIKQCGLEPDKDGRWTTKQIDQAINGSLEHERIRKTRAEADEIEQRNKETEGDLVNVDAFCAAYEATYVEMVRIIRDSRLSDNDQDALLQKLADTHKPK